jgi:tetratricopeptide (TPR) repeat protein
MNIYKKKSPGLLIAICIILAVNSVNSEEKKDDEGNYVDLFNKGNYKSSLEKINTILREKYSKRIKYRAVPTGFISTRDTGSRVDLKKIFRERKAEGFFIEENSEFHSLHLTAARIYDKQKKYLDSLNHYFQSLRFKKLEYKKDDVIFYSISQVFKKMKHFNAYINALETAYSLNIDNINYSLELGRELSKTSKRKRAIHYLKRYLTLEDSKVMPDIYLLLGNLNEDIGKYLETEKYYREYLKKKPDDPNINFALAYIAYRRTGDQTLAVKLFNKSITLLPEKDIYRRSKSFEYIADISLSNLDFNRAIQGYLQCIGYQNKVEEKVQRSKKRLEGINARINELKKSLLETRDFDDYNTYEFLLDDRGKIELELRRIKSNYNRLNPGKVRWNIAYAYEKSGDLNEAIKFYRNSIFYNYNPVKSRKKIEKLQLIIKRGY